MFSSKEIIIKDACIFIDLIDLGLLDHFYKLELKVLTTNYVIAEITDEDQFNQVNRLVEKGDLTLEDGKLDDISSLNDAHPKLSMADCSVLDLAQRKEAIILSTDQTLKKVSAKKDLDVRGILWVIEELQFEGILSIDEALIVLEKYPKVNSQAPIRETKSLVEKLNEMKEKNKNL